MNGKSLLAAACAISLACGYIAGKIGSASDGKTDAEFSAQSSSDRPTARENRSRNSGDNTLLDSILGGRPIGEIPAAEIAALIARLSKYDPDLDTLTRTKQSYQLQLLLAKLSTDHLAEIATAIQSDPEAKKTGSLNSVLAALAEKDSDRALAWLSTREKPDALYATVIGVIARNDPMAASDLLRNALLDGSVSQTNQFPASYNIGLAMAKLGVDPLLTYIDSLPGNQQSNMISNVMRSVPEGEQIRLLEELRARIEDGRLPGMSLSHIFPTAFASDEKGAMEWFSKLPDSDEKNSLRITTATDLFTRGEKEAAASWTREALAAAPGKEKQTLQGIIMTMSYSNPKDIPYLAQLLPEGLEFTAKDLENEARNSLFNDVCALTSIAAAIRDPGEQARLIAAALDEKASGGSRRFNANDFEILSHQITAMGFTGENATLLTNALEAARNVKTGNE